MINAFFLPSRYAVLFMLFLGMILIFLALSQAISTPERSFISSWTDTRSHTPRNATLGVAARIYVLSLPHRTDRRTQMEILRKALGLKWTYMEATNVGNPMIDRILDSVWSIRETNTTSFTWPENLPALNDHIDLWSPGYITSHRGSSNHRPHRMLCATQNTTVTLYEPNTDIPEHLILTPARIACWHSHLSVIQAVANDRSLKETDAAIILEDDIDMEGDIHRRLEYLWGFLPASWDIMYLGHCWSNETYYPALNAEDTATTRNLLGHVHPSRGPSCTHAYVLSRSGARRLLLHLRYAPFAYSRSIDLAISWLIQCGRLKSYSVVPSIVVQRKIGKSDIMPGTGSGWKDNLVDGVLRTSYS